MNSKNVKPSSNLSLFLELLSGSEQMVLDAGCGVGCDAIYLASEKGYEVTGIDICKVAIKLAKEKVRKNKVKNVYFKLEKIEELKFKNEYFDAAYSWYALGGKNLPIQIKELARVLKKNGILFIAIFTRTQYERRCEKEEINPLEFILKSVQPYFEIISQDIAIYNEIDDIGKHVHERLRLALRKK